MLSTTPEHNILVLAMSTDDELSRAILQDEEKFKSFPDLDTEDDSRRLSLRKLVSRGVSFIIIVIIAIAASFAVVSRLFNTSQHYDQCGTSAEEARARGCVFEVTGFSWVTRDCYDPETEQDFLEHIATNDIKLYRDYNFTIEIPMDEVRLGNGDGYYVYQEYHAVHCMFLIQKMHKAFILGKPLDGYTMPFSHTKHCIRQALLPPGARNNDHQASVIKWPYCGRPGGYSVDWRKPGQWTNV